nr:hypothetical protein [Desulfobulbaceae bacterium]
MVKNITVYLDETPTDFMNTLHCDFIVTEDETGAETVLNNILDSSGYHSIKELTDEIVGIFNIHRDAVLVAA